ncbi:hypothetical protein L486_07499 [Kwoniella mangroviensis CBS 10435]|uniref:Uncharacterized protein n=1 Tax=Kwoniella mangroviensis CBS 10435 TaxID=1331196 RepID=A0A1B9IHI3_9TREE|nr:uncharacterized protein I203_03321 [Kwoniella mangroviensis CBS 8507]OCF54844.1 hypothetical protein L486_07499 [Kwoniella mangroviensis CBS 10435]OCF67624.1 hypothetical protein I203_03321 [Kwoniella mangroviensis CBS 8507]OCF72870.1 hypothetical protein I204_06099 [Kwoniella mangroviensis CBS 8886]
MSLSEYNEKTPLLTSDTDQLSLAPSEATASAKEVEVAHDLAYQTKENIEEKPPTKPAVRVQWEEWMVYSIRYRIRYNRPVEYDEKGRKYNWSVWCLGLGLKHYQSTDRSSSQKGKLKIVKWEKGRFPDEEYIWPKGRGKKA